MNAQVPLYALYRQSAKPNGIRLMSLDELSQQPEEQEQIHRKLACYQIVWLKTGTAQAVLDDEEIQLYSPALISVPPDTNFELSAEATGFSLLLTSDYLDRIIWQLEGVADSITHRGHIVSKQVLHRRSNRVAEIFDQIELEYAGNHIHRCSALYGNTTLLIVEMARLLSFELQSDDAVSTIKCQVVFRNFKALVEAHFNEHWKISQYAAALATNERALRRICKAVAGVSPTELLQQRIVAEAKRNLLFSDKTVSEICYDLGFSDPSHFTKYFANSQGLSPSAYRVQGQSRSH